MFTEAGRSCQRIAEVFSSHELTGSTIAGSCQCHAERGKKNQVFFHRFQFRRAAFAYVYEGSTTPRHQAAPGEIEGCLINPIPAPQRRQTFCRPVFTARCIGRSPARRIGSALGAMYGILRAPAQAPGKVMRCIGRLRRNSFVPGWLVLWLVCSVAAACANRSPARSDPPTPSLRWAIHNVETRTTMEVSNSAGPISIHPGARVFVALVGEDLEGMHTLRLSGSMLQKCRGVDGREPVSSLTTIGYKPDEIFREVDFSWRCQEGWHYSDGQAVLAAECENRAGGKAGATLTLIRPD
jgi:hypothetical protein